MDSAPDGGDAGAVVVEGGEEAVVLLGVEHVDEAVPGEEGEEDKDDEDYEDKEEGEGMEDSPASGGR